MDNGEIRKLIKAQGLEIVIGPNQILLVQMQHTACTPPLFLSYITLYVIYISYCYSLIKAEYFLLVNTM